ncbi:MAG: hypothetical protein LBC74_01165 [Planctomycetaceae bacterium]|jgi:hypothetical protein|nr:hypothetical protein [Planctomycetaceae bacterium]
MANVNSIVLFSGGLDSTLAAKVLLDQGIGVVGLNFITPFHDASAIASEQAEALGIELILHRTGDEYIRLIANPQWGYGKAVNPCVDCRVAMCRVAADVMREREANFVATGEITGQRPNSQMQHQLNLIARESGLGGFLVRPLTAVVLEPTEAEKLDLVNRGRLYGYTGRGRGHLVVLAKRLGIKKIPQPSTGCALCEKSYAPRVVDLFKYELNPSNWDAEVLNAGRQVRLSPKLKAVIARNESQCNTIEYLYNKSDAKPAILFKPESFNAPTVMIIGTDEIDDEILQLGESLILEFTNLQKVDQNNKTIRVKYGNKTNPAETIYQNQIPFQKKHNRESL